MHTAEEVRELAESSNVLKEYWALHAYADLLEAMEEVGKYTFKSAATVVSIRAVAAEKQKARKG